MGRQPEERMTLNGLANLGTQMWPLGLGFTWANEKVETPDANFQAFTEMLYKGNGPVAAVLNTRLRVLTEIRFQWRNKRDLTLFGSPALAPIESPWPGGTTGDLVARMEQDTFLAGNTYWVPAYNIEAGRFLSRLRPDWVDVVTYGEPTDPDSSLAGIVYWPGGHRGGKNGIEYVAGQYVHYAPIPDPSRRWVGMSPLTPIVREAVTDGAMTRYKQKYLENSATPNFAISLKETVSPEAFERFRRSFSEAQAGPENAGKPLVMGGGADFTLLGTDWRGLDLKNVQGGLETRIATAGGVPPIIAGFSEGLESATYSNYHSAKRHFSDATLRPWWRGAAAALQDVLEVPDGAELWYDPSDVAFLQEDEKDAAEISQQQQVTIRGYVEAGFEPGSAVAAVKNGNLDLLKHTGLVSVQLQEPGSTPTTSQGGAV